MSMYQDAVNKEAADLISRAVNNMSISETDLAHLLATDHRTLQQTMGRLVVALIAEWAEAYDTHQFDDRNEGTVKWAAEVQAKVGQAFLPFI